MTQSPRLSISDALFGELPDDVKARYGLDKPAERADRRSKVQRSGDAAVQTPWQLSRAAWMAVARRVKSEISEDRVTSVAAGVTFFALLALFPAITALVSIYGLVADPETIVGTLDLLDRVVPAEAMELIRDQITSITSASGSALGLATVIGILAALWSANGGVKAIIDALNIAWFRRESRGLVRLNLVSLGFTLGTIVILCLMIAAIAVLPALLDAGGGGAVSLLRWPLMLAVLLIALAVLYRFGPDRDDARWEWLSPGAIFAAVGLVIASVLFSWYASSFADYNKTYGALGAVIGLLMWMWIGAIVVMVGAEINSAVERQMAEENGDPVEDEAERA